jgi:hypothetical protein
MQTNRSSEASINASAQRKLTKISPPTGWGWRRMTHDAAGVDRMPWCPTSTLAKPLAAAMRQMRRIASSLKKRPSPPSTSTPFGPAASKVACTKLSRYSGCWNTATFLRRPDVPGFWSWYARRSGTSLICEETHVSSLGRGTQLARSRHKDRPPRNSAKRVTSWLAQCFRRQHQAQASDARNCMPRPLTSKYDSSSVKS